MTEPLTHKLAIFDAYLASCVRESATLLDLLANAEAHDDPLVVAVAEVTKQLEEAHLRLKQALAKEK